MTTQENDVTEIVCKLNDLADYTSISPIVDSVVFIPLQHTFKESFIPTDTHIMGVLNINGEPHSFIYDRTFGQTATNSLRNYNPQQINLPFYLNKNTIVSYFNNEIFPDYQNVVAINVSISSRSESMSDLALANVEALATGEIIVGPLCVSDPR